MRYDNFLVYVHPAIQAFAFLLALIAMYQGYKRIAMQFGKNVSFPWKQHVKVGSYALILWMIGAGVGGYVTNLLFSGTTITARHSEIASYIMGLLLFSLVTGFIMNKYKKKRKYLPILHGLSSIVLLILVVYEAYLGMWVLFALRFM